MLVPFYIFLSLIFVNTITLYYLYTLKHNDHCNKSELINIMYDYYIFETIFIVLVALTIMYFHRKFKDKLLPMIFRSC